MQKSMYYMIIFLCYVMFKKLYKFWYIFFIYIILIYSYIRIVFILFFVLYQIIYYILIIFLYRRVVFNIIKFIWSWIWSIFFLLLTLWQPNNIQNLALIITKHIEVTWWVVKEEIRFASFLITRFKT